MFKIFNNLEFLNSINKDNLFLSGLEREALRIDSQGHLSKNKHPEDCFGSKLTHPFITCDYAESLIELISPVFNNNKQLSSFMTQLHQFVHKSLKKKGELLWNYSMPCIIDNEIEIADYGTSHLGRMKKLYRQGLKLRYGDQMQVIAGIHYNFSLQDSFLKTLKNSYAFEGQFQEFKNTQYMKMMRNYLRLAWVPALLFYNSHSCYEKFPISGIQASSYGDYKYLANGLGWRMSPIGYTNAKQEEVICNWNTLEDYISTIQHLVTTKSCDFSYISNKKVSNVYQQISQNKLQIENEYYSLLRPKVKMEGNIPPSYLLERTGIHYIEIRQLDIDPFSDIGINIETMNFMVVFLLYCLFLEEENNLSNEDLLKIKKNLVNVSLYGRNPKQKIFYDKEECKLKNIWVQFIESFSNFAQKYFPALLTNENLNYFSNFFFYDKDLSSISRFDSLLYKNKSYIETNLMLARDTQKKLQVDSSKKTFEHFDKLRMQSILKQQVMEDFDINTDFDDYLNKYFAYYK